MFICKSFIDWANDDIALIRGGEEELALELFCEQVHEIGLSLDRDQKESIRKMIEILAVEPRYFKMIDV